MNCGFGARESQGVWTCSREESHTGAHVPRLTASARADLLMAESRMEAIFSLADFFRIPVTNNMPRFEESGEAVPHTADLLTLLDLIYSTEFHE